MAKRKKADGDASTSRKGTRKNARQPRSDKGNASRNALPASVSASNPDRQREASRRLDSERRFQTNLSEEDRQKQRDQSSRIERESSKADDKKRAQTLSEKQREDGDALTRDQLGVTGQVDHAILNHRRAEHAHNGGGPKARIEGPAPVRLKALQSDEQVLETLRLETKADNLYFMRREERESDEPRPWVIDAINARLREVQGDPILPE